MARTRDRGAGGRAAALEVRREKIAARRQLVAAFARRRRERGRSELSISQAVRLVERATGTRWSKGTVAEDLRRRNLAQPAGPRRKHPKPEPRECEGCGVTFTPKDASQVARGNGRFHSTLCARRHGAQRETARRAVGERHARADVRLAEINAEGELTMRQAAERVGVAESTLHRFASLGLIEVGRRCQVEGESWTLVPAAEVERFEREAWPQIRRRAMELWAEHRLPKTWSAKRRRAWARRIEGSKTGGRPPKLIPPEVLAGVAELVERDWGRPAIQDKLGLTEHYAREAIKQVKAAA